jgi:hypothetical protein
VAKIQVNKQQSNLPVPIEAIGTRIYMVRGQKVMLDSDLASLYKVPTKSLNLAVRRNLARFPEDFMFQLTKQEASSLRFQTETSNRRGGRRYIPHVFTEQGIAMLSSVLKSTRAIQVNIVIMRAFVKIREVLATHKDVVQKLSEIEKIQRTQGMHIAGLWKQIEKLMRPPKPSKYRIGFPA